MLNYQHSQNFTLGIELELQLISRNNFDLVATSESLLNQLNNEHFPNQIKPEITQAMLELNSSPHQNAQSLLKEMYEIRNYVTKLCDDLNINLMGGGSHPFQLWNDRKIYPNALYEKAAYKYGYLAKMLTIFGLHIHIGCANSDDAIYLTHALARFTPQLIALSASSPFCQGIDTEFDSCRANVLNSFPTHGLPPVTSNWDGFVHYFNTMKALQIVENITNFYWDIRPRPDYGTIEIRVCDAPLTIEKAVILAAYAQTLAKYILTEKPITLTKDDYHIYRYNRFQACRFGFNGKNIDLETLRSNTIAEDILKTYENIQTYSKQLNNEEFIQPLIVAAQENTNDAQLMRKLFNQGITLKEIIKMQCDMFASQSILALTEATLTARS